MLQLKPFTNTSFNFASILLFAKKKRKEKDSYKKKCITLVLAIVL